MKTIKTSNGKTLTMTNYKPQFGFKSLVSLLEPEMGYINSGKSRNTNSYYIECGTSDFSKTIEIRISDHTKYIDTCTNETHELILMHDLDSLSLDIVSPEDFKKAKELIFNFIGDKN